MDSNLKYELKPHEAMVLDQLIIKQLSNYLGSMAQSMGIDPAKATLNSRYSISGPAINEPEPDDIQHQG